MFGVSKMFGVSVKTGCAVERVWAAYALSPAEKMMDLLIAKRVA